MAFKDKRGEHAFKKIEQDIKGGKIKNVLLLCGPEKYLVKFYCERLTGLFVNEATSALDLVTIDGDNLSAQNIIENCETLSLMSERKVVMVPDFMPADGKSQRGFSDKELEALIEYLPNVPDSALLIFTSGEPDNSYKTPKFRGELAKAGTIYDFQPLDDSLLRSFIEKRLRNTGKTYRPSIVSAIINESGYGNKYVEYTLYNLDNDLMKLAAYAVGSEITAEDVRAVISSNPENNIFALLDSIGQNRKGDALIMLNNLFNNKVNPFMIQSMAIGQLELILMCKELTERGCSVREVMKLTRNTSEFKVKKAIGMSKKYSHSQLKHILIGAYEIDRNIKTGNFDQELAVEYFISSI